MKSLWKVITNLIDKPDQMMRVVFSNRAFTAIAVETLEKIQTETGGLFLGVFEDNTWYVIEAIDPGPNSVFQYAYFEYDKAYTQHLINKISKLYASRLFLIGLWHRHPASLDRFSSTDDITNSKYAQMNANGAISMLVNVDPNFRLTVYHVSLPLHYEKIQYVVGDQFVPEKYLRYKSDAQITDLFETNKRELSISDNYFKVVSFFEGVFKNLPHSVSTNCFNEVSNLDYDHLIQSISDDVFFLSEELGFSCVVEKTDVGICLRVKGLSDIIVFSQDSTGLFFSHGNYRYSYHPGCFKAEK